MSLTRALDRFDASVSVRNASCVSCRGLRRSSCRRIHLHSSSPPAAASCAPNYRKTPTKMLKAKTLAREMAQVSELGLSPSRHDA
jgi:hypothetical protein